MGDELFGMPDVEFDFATSEALKTGFRNAAGVLGEQRSSRVAWRGAALADFKGFFSTVFERNGQQQVADLDNIVENLKEVAAKVEILEQKAREENERRRVARDWAQRQADRTVARRVWDSIFGGEEPPEVNYSSSGPAGGVAVVPPRQRETPAQGSGGGGGGTSSARPDGLRSFTASTRGGDDVLGPVLSGLSGLCDAFAASCSWAKLDASSVLGGFSTWLRQNGEDAVWASTVADAFERAGGSGVVSTLADSAIEATLRSCGVPDSRAMITIDPPVAYGDPPTTGYANDPVNVATGNFLEPETDLGFSGGCGSLVFSRMYNSVNAEVGGFGVGWSSWTETRLVIDDESARWVLPEGRVVVFPRLGAGWDRAAGDNFWLVAEVDRCHGQVLVVTDNAGGRWVFTLQGRWVSSSCGAGTGVTAVYDDGGRLVGMTHERGRSVAVVWGPMDRVVAVTASDGRRVDYVYDSLDRLVSATGPLGTRSYRWDENGLVAAVVDPDGVVEVENTYDTVGRVVSQRSPFGRVTRFVYLSGRVTVVSDPDGDRSNTWISDERGRLIGVVDSDEQRQSISYDRFGNPVMVTERGGATTLSEYDTRGRRVSQITASGARLGWVYDDADRVTSVTVGNDEATAITTYTYEGASRNPVSVCDPCGGITHLTWVDGLLTRVVDPAGVELSFGYDVHGDLVSTTNADGVTARLDRDEVGRVIAATTPLGHTTSYRYDLDTGLLLSRTDPDGGTWRYLHTAAGRMSATIDPTGARTDIEHGAHGEESAVIDPLGRSVSCHFDDLGNPAELVLPDGSNWRFTYDPMSRLTATTDPAGGRWEMEYSPNGYLSATTDAVGVRRTVDTDVSGLPTRLVHGGGDQTEAVWDRLGRVVSTIDADGSTQVHRYDLCGRLTELVDAAGGVTRIERDLAGRPVRVSQPMGHTYQYGYDSCGRWVSTTSTGGDRYEMIYDADSRIVGELWPTGEQVSTEFDAAGRIIARTAPGQGTVRFGYDLAGRIVKVSDRWNGHRKFHYDTAGQLVAAVNSLGGVTRFEYDELARQVAVIDPLGGRTTRSYDAMNRLVAETDPLGRVTRYGYDLAGHQTTCVDATGSTMQWTYDDAGLVRDTIADGRLLSRVERNYQTRELHITEGDATHELAWDTNGGLLRRLRNGVGISYSYDANGRRTSMTRPDGSSTSYEYDENNRLCALTHPGIGRAVIERDMIGRIVSLNADGLHSTWRYANGGVVEHVVNHNGSVHTTCIDRDADGHVRAETNDGVRTDYTYDTADQLIAVTTSEGTRTEFVYDANGRLITETTNQNTIHYSYDAAGQLLTRSDTNGNIVEYHYDQAGRRTREHGPDGERRFSWDPRGYLCKITAVHHKDDTVTTSTVHDLLVDALGELAEIDHVPLHWDTAAGLPTLAQIGTNVVVNALAATAITNHDNAAWIMPDTTGRDTDTPWGIPANLAPTDLPTGTSVSSSGGVLLNGLDWMHARVYDPTTRGFLSTDPLEAITATGWAGNPYSFAGNNPIENSDPLGLRPVTDEELQAYRDASHGWIRNNWEYIAGGAMIVGGVAIMCTGIGGPIGGAMIAGAVGSGLTTGGVSVIAQKASTGSVNWGRAGVNAAVGAAAGVFGGAVAGNIVSRFGSTLIGNTLGSAAAGGIAGGAVGGADYLASGQPITPEDLAYATLSGLGLGVTIGALGGALSTAARNILRSVKPVGPPMPRHVWIDGFAVPGVPKGAVGVPAENGKGFIYAIPPGTPELSERVAFIRIMDPKTTGRYPYPEGYAVYMDSMKHTIHPHTGRSIPPSDPYAHIPLGRRR